MTMESVIGRSHERSASHWKNDAARGADYAGVWLTPSQLLAILLLRCLVQLGRAVHKYCRSQCENKQSKEATQNSAERQSVQNISSCKRIEERLCRLCAHVTLRFAE